MSLAGYTLIGTIVLSGIFGIYFWWSQGQISELNRELSKEVEARKQTEETIVGIKNDINIAIDALNVLNNETARIKERTSKLSDLLSEHDLDYLASQKPGLIERRANDKTEEVLDRLETISQRGWSPVNPEEQE